VQASGTGLLVIVNKVKFGVGVPNALNPGFRPPDFNVFFTGGGLDEAKTSFGPPFLMLNALLGRPKATATPKKR